jgi:hypothetical protein
LGFKYFDITITSLPSSASAILVNDFQALVSSQFSNSTDYYEIEEESTIGSGTYTTINVRITTALNTLTGEKLSDDFKQILFEDLNHNAQLGKKYYFSNNYWICTYSEAIKTLTANCMVRRANSMLRWVDEKGIYYEEPVCLDYPISRPRDEAGSVNPPLPAGYITGYCQLNTKTVKIKGNQRFIFGPESNRVVFKTFGDGTRAYLNQETLDDESANLLMLSMGGHFLNPDVDNVTLGIADYYKDFNKFPSGSSIGTYDIIITPPTNKILVSGSQTYTVNYYSGSDIHSGSFIFTVSGSSVPVANYTMTTLTGNSFSLVNNQAWLDNTLDIIASGSSGSRILNIELKDKW